MMTSSDAAIARIVTEYIHGSDHPDLAVYRRDFGSKFDRQRWVAEIRRRCELGDFRGRRLQGDICSLDLPYESFDGIYSSEAIEHVRDLDAMFRRCFGLLKPGGRILIVNDSNRFNSAFREATFKMWKERDESWEHARWLRDEIRPVEHRDAKPYAAMREAVIRGAAPSLDDASVARLVRATAGMVRPEIVSATRAFIAGEPLPEPPAYSWCRNPETGEYAERLLDPFELADMLRDSGFRNVQVRHGFNRFPLRLLNGVQLRPLNQVLFELRGLFYLVADKPPMRASTVQPREDVVELARVSRRDGTVAPRRSC